MVVLFLVNYLDLAMQFEGLAHFLDHSYLLIQRTKTLLLFLSPVRKMLSVCTLYSCLSLLKGLICMGEALLVG